MRAFVITGPGQAEIQDVPSPIAREGEVVVDVERVGVCGTDVELFTGEMSYLHTGATSYPIRIGHEWTGTVASVGEAVDPRWLGRRVTGDTMVGCGRCARCLSGRHHVCPSRHEVGIRDGHPGALAEQLLMPVTSLYALPMSIDATLGALVEPCGNAVRAVDAAALERGERLLVLGAGTIGLLVAQVAATRGAEVHLMVRSEASRSFARSCGFHHVWRREELPELPFHAVVDASDSAELPALAVDLVEPAGRVVCIGLAGEPSLVDTRAVALKDIMLVGILGASAGLQGAIELFASGQVDPRPLVAATVGLAATADILAGRREVDWGSGPKVHVDPRR